MEPRKRQRSSEVSLAPAHADAAEYKRGSIVRMRFINFVTYENVEFRPGPLMNVVLGPNGTGKSSIVCAIALGLGYSTDVLGRSRHPADFIKHGHRSGSIEIELKNEPRNLIIRRDIDDKNHSLFFIDGKKTPQQEVQTRVKSLGVQVDNLCHFLPQEKVYAFAALSPQDRLRETERAVGKYDMLVKHERLVKLRDEQKKELVSNNESMKHLETLRARNAVLERDVIRFREREKLMAQVALLEKKRPWLQFEKQRQTASDLKTQHAAALSELKLKEAEHAPVQRQIDGLQKTVQDFDKAKEKIGADLKKFDQQRKKIGEDVGKLDEDYDTTKENLENLHKQAEERKERLAKAKSDIETLQEQLSTKPSEADLQEEKARILKETSAINTALSKVQREVTELGYTLRGRSQEVKALEDKLRALSDEKQQLLARLETKEKNTVLAYQWLQKNRNLFQQQIFGPCAMEITCRDEQAAKYLENAMNRFTITAFVVQTDADWSKLRAQLKEARLTGFNVALSEHLNPPQFPCSPELLKRYRAVDFLLNYFNAPAPVVQAIINAQSLENVVVAQQNVDYTGVFASVPKVKSVLTPTEGISCKVSKYGKKLPSFNRFPLRAPKLLRTGDDSLKQGLLRELEQKKQAEREANDKITAKNKEQTSLTAEKTKLESARTQVMKQIAEVDGLKKKIAALQKLIDTYSSEESTLEAEEKLKAELATLSKKRLKAVQDCHSVVTKLTTLALENDKLSLSRMQANARRVHLMRELERRDAELAELRRTERNLKQQCTEALSLLKELKQIAEEKAPLTPELKAQFIGLPNTLEELNVEITNAQRKADANYANNPQVIEEYEERKKQIESLEAAQRSRASDLAQRNNEIEELKKEWEPAMLEMVKQIDNTFGQLFARNNCEGRVALVPHEDFDKYALDIKVRFRDNEPLASLDQHKQSGGERSVSTMLYLIALHEMSACPFRLVDEINQGMDPRNERLVYTYTHDIASKKGRPQFFLITPKLLFDLEFNENTTVLVVNNGPFMTNQGEWQKVETKLLKAE